MAEFIVSAGTATGEDTSPPVITLSVAGKDGDLALTSLQSLSAPNSAATFEWQQFDVAGKRSVPTTKDFSLSTKIVINKAKHEGVAIDASNVADSASVQGLYNLFVSGQSLEVSYNRGNSIYSGIGYVTTLSEEVSPESPVWTSSITIKFDGTVTLTPGV